MGKKKLSKAEKKAKKNRKCRTPPTTSRSCSTGRNWQ